MGFFVNRTSAAVILSALMTGSATGTRQQQETTPVSATQEQKPATILASDKTKADFPIINNFGTILAGNLETVLILSVDDLDFPELEAEINLERRRTNGEITPSEYNAQAAKIEYQSAAKLSEVLEAQYPDFVKMLNDDIIIETANNLISGSAACMSIDCDLRDSQNSAALILTPYPNQSAVQTASRLSGIPKSAIKDLPGTDEDWRNFTLCHELGHVPHVPFATDLRNEVQADRASFDTLRGIFTDRVSDLTQINDAVQSMRAIASFGGQSYYTHITNAAISSSHEGPSPSGQTSDFANGLQNALQAVYLEIGAKRYFMGEYINLMDNMILGLPPSEGKDVVVITKQEETALKQAVQDLSNGNYDSLYSVSDMLSENTANALRAEINAIDTKNGEMIARSNPETLYETTREMYLAGKFDDNPIGKQYAYEFLVASQKHASDYFGTTRWPDDTFVPPVFDKNGQYQKPIADTEAKAPEIK